MSRKIAGYRLGERLGQGSAAAVYLARDERLHYQVAVKVLAPDPARGTAFTETLIRESRAAAAIDHPHIIPVYDAGEEDGTPYVVMRYARGGDARSLLRRRGPLALAPAWRIIAQIASALDAAHAQGLVHRDVKPSNILFDADDTVAGRRPGPGADRVPAHAYLSDFGVGRVFPPSLVTGAEQLTDALGYLAPEQIEGDDLDGRADLYALACTSFELLCGVPPFGAEQGLTLMYSQLYAPPPVAAARRAGLPAAVDAVLARALAKDPAGRYPSCGRFAAELRAALGLGSVLRAGPAPSPGPGEFTPAPLSREFPPAGLPPAGLPPDQRGPRLPRPALAAAALIVLIIAVGAVFALSRHPASGSSAAGAPAASPRTSPTASPATSPPGTASSPALSPAGRQAAALDTLLISSSTARTALHRAVRQVAACVNMAGAVSDLQNVVNQRTTEFGRASALAVSGLPGGQAVKSALAAALSLSLQADQDYLTWARQQRAGGCTPSGQSATYNAAFSESERADAAKAAFVRVWNPVAARYGLAQNSPRDI